jgi:hypothetical protein
MNTSNLNPSVVKSGLDKLFFVEYNIAELPEIAGANDPNIFRQLDSSKASETIEEFKGSGEWSNRGETQVASQGQFQALYSQTLTNGAMARGVTIAKRFLDDDQHNMLAMHVQEFAGNGRSSRDKDALSLYRTSFTATGGDAQYLFDTDHPVTGGTMSNKGTSTFGEAALNTAIIALAEQKKRDGLIAGYMPSVLLVPIALYKTACEVLMSEQRSNTPNNDINVYSKKYPGLMIKTSPYLGLAAGGSDTAWFLLSRLHGMLRYNREEINTRMIDWKQREDRSYFYDGEFRQTVGQAHPFGAWGSTG